MYILNSVKSFIKIREDKDQRERREDKGHTYQGYVKMCHISGWGCLFSLLLFVYTFFFFFSLEQIKGEKHYLSVFYVQEREF